jgi:transcriptional regulator with XRE-family HTH domain
MKVKQEVENLEELVGVIESRRKSLGLSQEDTSILSGLNRTWINSLERGHKPGITIRSLLKLTDALRINVVLNCEEI